MCKTSCAATDLAYTFEKNWLWLVLLMHALRQTYFIMRQIRCDITALVVTLMVLVGYSLSQSCSPTNNSEGMIIPNTDLPTTGKKVHYIVHYAYYIQ